VLRLRARRDPVTAALLPNAKLEVVPLELELAQLVLAHHSQNSRDLVEIHHSISAVGIL
jgi:hypothetical protein